MRRWVTRTIGRLPLRLALALALAVSLGLAKGSGAEDAPGAGATESAASIPSSPPLDPVDDPRLQRTGPGERTLRKVGDAAFSRPIHFARLLTGIAMLPVAVPIAALFADWHDAIDICVIGPYEMTFERPLGS